MFGAAAVALIQTQHVHTARERLGGNAAHVVGIAHMGAMKDVGRIGIRALVYFEVVSTIALLIGLVVVSVLKPGAGVGFDPSTADVKAVAAYTAESQHLSTLDFILNIIPDT